MFATNQVNNQDHCGIVILVYNAFKLTVDRINTSLIQELKICSNINIISNTVQALSYGLSL